jgi:Xaa-Pro aminopeptidase
MPDITPFLIQRLRKAQKLVKNQRLEALYVTNLTNIRYLTGIEASAGVMLVTPKKVMLFLDSRYSEMAYSRAPKKILVMDPAKILDILSAYKRIGIESEDMTVARLNRLKSKLKNRKFVHTFGILEGLRRKKDLYELSLISRASSLTKRVLNQVPTLLKIGITERQLSWKIYELCQSYGAQGLAFETIVAFGEHSSRPHHHPTERKLKKGDVVQIDMGARYQGYCSDYSRVYCTAPKTREQSKAYKALSEAKKKAESLLKKNVTNHELDIAARKVLKDYGYDKEFSHSLGHGLGLDIHESPTLSKRAPMMKLQKGEVVTIEPGLYFEGKWGMRLEDTWVVS